MHDEDIGLKKHWGILAVVAHSTTMTTLAFEHLAQGDKQITFLHSYPGWVYTDNLSRLTAPKSSGIGWRILLALLHRFVGIMRLTFGMSSDESGERQVFNLIIDRFHSGAYRIDHLSDQVLKNGVLEHYRESGWSARVWDHTVQVFEEALTREI
jgi:hypothetical protein